MAAKTLTRTQGYALTDTKKAIRLSVDILVTRTAVYRWSDPQDAWQVDHQGLRVEHVKKHRWDNKAKQFVPCHCDKCGSSLTTQGRSTTVGKECHDATRI